MLLSLTPWCYLTQCVMLLSLTTRCHVTKFGYSVKPDYCISKEGSYESVFFVDMNKAFCSLWNSSTPFSVKGFSWRCFFNRLPTKKNLRSRCVILPNKYFVCSLCKVVEDNLENLFFMCNVVSVVWRKIIDWLNIATSDNGSAWEHFASWSCCRKNKEYKGKEGMV